MKVVLLARDGRPGQIIAEALSREASLSVIWESGALARRRKLARYFPWRKPWLWPLGFLNAVAAVVFNRRMQTYLHEVLPVVNLTVESFTCEDANEDRVIEKLKEWKPDVVFVYGTALLSARTLSAAPLFLNLHGGIVPDYRNVHGEFWALKNGEPNKVGTSVLFMTAGIDSGDVLLQESVAASDTESVRKAVAANVKLAAHLAVEALRLIKANSKLNRRPQSDFGRRAKSHPTPGASAILRALFTGQPPI